jgi:hypothetical protein
VVTLCCCTVVKNDMRKDDYEQNTWVAKAHCKIPFPEPPEKHMEPEACPWKFCKFHARNSQQPTSTATMYVEWQVSGLTV